MADAIRFPPKLRLSIKQEKSEASARIFEDKLFYIMEDPLTEEFVNFSANDLSVLIAGKGGRLFTQKTKEALIIDKKEEERASLVVHVVRWGSSKSDAFLDDIPNREAVTWAEVTPIWVFTCIELNSFIAPEEVARLFKPHETPWRRINDAAMRLSITGFTGAERLALVHFIKAVGAIYDASMRKSTLHLICAKKSGPKYEKAIEWNVNVVDMEWLLDLAQTQRA